ncbi:MAG: hypothetical protein ACRC3G_03150, partial [Bacteroidales bacterium]
YRKRTRYQRLQDDLQGLLDFEEELPTALPTIYTLSTSSRGQLDVYKGDLLWDYRLKEATEWGLLLCNTPLNLYSSLRA